MLSDLTIGDLDTLDIAALDALTIGSGGGGGGGGEMATYLELRALFTDSNLRNRLQVAVADAANTIMRGSDSTDPPWDQTAGQHDLRVKWANSVLSDIESAAGDVLKVILAENKASTVSQIQNSADATIQSQVNAVVDALATAQFG